MATNDFPLPPFSTYERMAKGWDDFFAEFLHDWDGYRMNSHDLHLFMDSSSLVTGAAAYDNLLKWYLRMNDHRPSSFPTNSAGMKLMIGTTTPPSALIHQIASELICQDPKLADCPTADSTESLNAGDCIIEAGEPSSKKARLIKEDKKDHSMTYKLVAKLLETSDKIDEHVLWADEQENLPEELKVFLDFAVEFGTGIEVMVESLSKKCREDSSSSAALSS